jgi:hypothetical protein
MSVDTEHLRQDLEIYEFFSLQLDESTDACHVAQSFVSIRMVFNDGKIKEEELKAISLHGETRGEDTPYLTAEINDLNTELQCENKTIIKMKGTIDYFKAILKLLKTQQMKDVLIELPSVQSRSDGTFDVSVYILCIAKLLKDCERRFKDFECMKFTNPFQERNVSENAELKGKCE